MKKKYGKYWGSIDNINLMLFIAIVLDPRYKLNFVKYWIKEWYGKNKGDAISSKVWDALNRLYVERVGQNATFSSSGSGASLFRNSRPSVGNASKYNRIKSYNNKFKQHLADQAKGSTDRLG